MESLNASFVARLRCPLTQMGLQWITLKEAQDLGLSAPEMGDWSGALLRSDGKALYPVRKGLPVMLAEAIHPVEVGAISPSS